MLWVCDLITRSVTHKFQGQQFPEDINIYLKFVSKGFIFPLLRRYQFHKRINRKYKGDDIESYANLKHHYCILFVFVIPFYKVRKHIQRKLACLQIIKDSHKQRNVDATTTIDI